MPSADQFIYHEMMAHVPMLAHGQVERVLILGGGDYGLAEEVLEHRTVRTLVQIDDSRTLRLAPALKDERLQLRIGSAAQFLSSTRERFDLILADSTCPGATGVAPITRDVLRDARGCLTSGGLLIAPLGVPFMHPHAFSAAMKSFASVFAVASLYLVPVPSILGGPVAIGWASNVIEPDAPGIDVLAARFARARIATDYYTPEVHEASFVLPRYIKVAVSAATRSEDDHDDIEPSMDSVDERRGYYEGVQDHAV